MVAFGGKGAQQKYESTPPDSQFGRRFIRHAAYVLDISRQRTPFNTEFPRSDDKKEIAAVRQSQPHYCRALPYSAVAAGQSSLENVVGKWRV